MSQIIGRNCVESVRNIGGESCTVEPGMKKGHIQVPKGWNLDISVTPFTKTYVESQVQLGNFRMLGNAFTVTSETPDPTTEESPSKQIAVAALAFPMVTSIYKTGWEFHQSLYTQSGHDKYDIIEVYEDGSVKVVLQPDNKTIKGFACGMYQVFPYQDANGTIKAQTTLKYQLIDNYEINVLGTFLTQLDFNPISEINNIVDVLLEGIADVSLNKIYVSAKWSRNQQVALTGFASANLRLTLIVAGIETTDVIVGAVPYVDGKYVITPTTTIAASGQKWKVYLTDATVPTDTAKVLNKYYQGETAEIQPVA